MEGKEKVLMSKKAAIGLVKRRRGRWRLVGGATSALLSFFLLPVSWHCAPAVSIATAPLMEELLFTARVEWMAAAAAARQRLLGA